jgi:GNAT superfamily N-acetyltransferase
LAFLQSKNRELTMAELTKKIIIRPITSSDSIAEITDLLHRAYKKLADMGLRYTATWQDEDRTRRRLSEGQGFVACLDDKIIGIITLYFGPRERGPDHYKRPDVAHFGQFGVEPLYQGQGIGSALLQHIENLARQAECTEIALDTAEPALHLIDMYTRKGFHRIGQYAWPHTNYVSVVMTKPLAKNKQ